MRIVHVCAYFAPAYVHGGPPRSVLRLSQAQLHDGHRVHVVTTTANGRAELPPHVVAAGAFEGVPVTYCRRGWPRGMFRAPGMQATIERALADADVLHVHGLWNAAVWSAHAAAATTRTPYMLSPRGMLEPSALAHDRLRKVVVYRLRDHAVVRDAAVLHATSDVERGTLARRYPAKRIVNVPNGVDAIEPAPGSAGVRARYALPPGAPLILFLGRIHPLKRLDRLADAFLAVRAVRPDARLVIAGPDETGLQPQIRRRLAGADSAVTWTGGVDDAEKQALLAESSVLVLCSDSESFGLSVAEALAASRPVVVTRTCPWRDVESAGAGFWVEPSPEAIAAALVRILADPTAAAAMGAQGRALIEARYSWSGVSRQLVAVYETMLAAA